MPKCDTCGFAHAQADRCINCGNTDPFRRHRVRKFALAVGLLILAIAAAIYFYLRYTEIERSVREAEMAAEQTDGSLVAPVPRAP